MHAAEPSSISSTARAYFMNILTVGSPQTRRPPAGGILDTLTIGFVAIVLVSLAVPTEILLAVPLEQVHQAFCSRQAVLLAFAALTCHLTWRAPRRKGDSSLSAPRNRRQANACPWSQNSFSKRPPAAGQPQQPPDVSKAAPVSAPAFEATALVDQVDELIGQIMPTTEGNEVAESLAKSVQDAIREVLPEVHVIDVVSGDVRRGTAYGVAVPEVDLVVIVPLEALARHMKQHHPEGNHQINGYDARKLQKSAIRICTNLLVTELNGFKFRRSAFRGQEPKVTLMSPLIPRIGKAIPVDVSVNSWTPLYNAALVAECAKIDPRARELILFVKRWAKDRGICYATKGHLPPYAWTLLTIYFLQVGLPDGPLLPPLRCSVSEVAAGDGAATLTVEPLEELSRASCSGRPLRTGELFSAFISFYCKEVDWNTEVTSLQTGRRTTQEICNLARHVLRSGAGTIEAAPCIQDPFEPTRNRGTYVTLASFKRLRQELVRAEQLTATGTSLSKILEPWVPLEPHCCEDGTDDSDGEEGRRQHASSGQPHRHFIEARDGPKMVQKDARPWQAAGARSRQQERSVVFGRPRAQLGQQEVKPSQGHAPRKEVVNAAKTSVVDGQSDASRKPGKAGATPAPDAEHVGRVKTNVGSSRQQTSPRRTFEAKAAHNIDAAPNARSQAPLQMARRRLVQNTPDRPPAGGAPFEMRPWQYAKPSTPSA
mmetsp:Transcript_47967/g.111938  ORF Transcript_47967/g.111938 Transcript_47967/m.111938 type:complete len:712 (-) Transcript_47967:72-2207(-)